MASTKHNGGAVATGTRASGILRHSDDQCQGLYITGRAVELLTLLTSQHQVGILHPHHETMKLYVFKLFCVNQNNFHKQSFFRNWFGYWFGTELATSHCLNQY